jgi:purine-binding chemotaxis protein CheW
MTDGATSQLVVFSLGEEQYALPIEDVSEIIRHARARSITSEDPWIRGVIGLRGKIIPIFDLAARLGLAVETGDETSKIVIVETATGHVGVTVDEVDEVLTVAAEQIEGEILKDGDRLVVVLDPGALFVSG